MAEIKRKKKNKALPLIILALVLGAMVIGYMALTAANEKAEQDKLLENTADSETLTVTSHSTDEITEISYKYAGADEIAFTSASGAWAYKADSSFPLDKTTVGYMASALADIQADREITEGEDSIFGFTDDATTVKYTAAGAEHTVILGDYNSFSAAYYIKVDGRIYLTADDLEYYFSYTLDELMVLDEMPYDEWSDAEYMTSVTVKYGESENVSISADSAAEMASLLSDIALDTVADYSVTSDEDATYGLGKGSVTVSYRSPVTTTDAEGNESTVYLDSVYELRLGNKTDDGYYVSPKDSAIAYLAPLELVDALLEYEAEAETEAESEEAAETESAESEESAETEAAE